METRVKTSLHSHTCHLVTLEKACKLWTAVALSFKTLLRKKNRIAFLSVLFTVMGHGNEAHIIVLKTMKAESSSSLGSIPYQLDEFGQVS